MKCQEMISYTDKEGESYNDDEESGGMLLHQLHFRLCVQVEKKVPRHQVNVRIYCRVYKMEEN